MVVSFDGRIEIADTLDEALLTVFGAADGTGVPDEGERDAGDTTEPPTGTVEEQVRVLLAQAAASFEEADAALRDGDLVTYAQKIEEAAEAIAAANALTAVEVAPEATTTTTTVPSEEGTGA